MIDTVGGDLAKRHTLAGPPEHVMQARVSCGPCDSGQAVIALSVVVPAFNEESGIGATLDRLLAVLPRCDLAAFEIIVVDDGSTDGTFAIAGGYPGVTLIKHRANRGYGAALKTGIRHARHGWIGIIDADGTYPVERIPDLLAALAGQPYDMLIAARTGKQVAIPLVRRPAKWMIGHLARFVAGQPIPDLNSGFRLFKRSVALRLLSMLPDGFSFTTTITLGMLANGYLVDYVPIDYHARIGRSKIRPIQDTLNFVQLVLRIALYFAPLKIFLPVSGLLLLIALAWALFTKLALGQLADVSTLVIAMTGVQVAAVGLLAESIHQRLPNHYREEQ